MGSANQVPISNAGYYARAIRRNFLFVAADLCTIISRVLLTHGSFSFQVVWGVYGSLRVRTAQAIRAVLLAMATVATRAGLRSSNDVSHLLARSGCDRVCLTSDVIPTTSSCLMYWSPIFVIRPSFSLPPLDLFAGVKPSQAANSRPFLN